LLVNGINPLWATLAGAVAGSLAGATTGILHTRFKIHGLLSGILVMTALYSINLHVMGRSNVPLMSSRTLTNVVGDAARKLFSQATTLNLAGWKVQIEDAAILVATVLLVVSICFLLYAFFRTNIGTAMRATGDNAQMIRSLGAHTGNMIVAGLALSNGLVAFSGALLAQYQGFSDVQMGIGMVVWGLASVIIGESLVRTRQLSLTITGAVMGSVLFRLLVAIALRWGLNPNDLKLITAVFVLLALVLPGILERWTSRKKVMQRA
jgi:putative ABC transport system permease protein